MAPVSFVAGGIQQSSKDKIQISTEEKNDNESENLDDNISTSRFKKLLKYNYIFIYIPTYIIYIACLYLYSEEEKPVFNFDIDQELAGLRKKQSQVNPRLMNKGLGDWEKHTKGIGAKLLLGVIY